MIRSLQFKKEQNFEKKYFVGKKEFVAISFDYAGGHLCHPVTLYADIRIIHSI